MLIIYKNNIYKIIASLLIMLFCGLGISQEYSFSAEKKNRKTSSSKSKKKSRPKKRTSSKKNRSSDKSTTKQPASVEEGQQELQKLYQSIETDKKKIQNLENAEKSTLKSLKNDKWSNTKLQKYLKRLNNELYILRDSITTLTTNYQKLSYKIKITQTEFSKLSNDFSFEGAQPLSKLLIMKSSYNSEIRRIIYLKRLITALEKYIGQLYAYRNSIALSTNILKEKSEQQQQIKNKKEREKEKLNKSIAIKNNQINKYKRDKSALLKSIAQKEQSAKKIRNIIAELIKKELKEQKEQKPSSKSTEESHSINPTGKYLWPSSSRSILRGYGENRNSETNTIFDNPGIDIGAASGSTVKSIDEGVVSLIHWLPGYGTLIIINHGGGLRSVYANLSTVYVKKDEKVAKGKAIGRSGESVDGEFLHFELWQGSRRLNPLGYLK